jgi:hypothetical protein
MSTIQELKKEQEEKFSSLFKECGVFFAFSNKQFDEGKTPLKEGEEYVSIVNGGYMPESNTEAFKKGFQEILSWFKSEAKNIEREHIVYELNNYECFYTGDLEDAFSALPYSQERITEVYNEVRKGM